MSKTPPDLITRIADAIEADVTDRRGWAQEWGQFDSAVKKEIRVTWYKLIAKQVRNVESIYDTQPVAVMDNPDGSDAPVHMRHRLACWKLSPTTGPAFNHIQAQRLANAERVTMGANKLTRLEELAIQLVAAEHLLRQYGHII